MTNQPNDDRFSLDHLSLFRHSTFGFRYLRLGAVEDSMLKLDYADEEEHE